MTVASVSFFAQLRKLIPELPEKMIKMNIEISCGLPVLIHAEFYPSESPHVPCSKTFCIVEESE